MVFAFSKGVNEPYAATDLTDGVWIELVRVRSSALVLERAAPAVAVDARRLNDAAKGPQAHVLQHALYDGDLAVMLVWRDQRAPGPSPVGLRFAEAMADLGTVDHAIWRPHLATPAPHTEH